VEATPEVSGAFVNLLSGWWGVGGVAGIAGLEAVWRRDERKADPEVVRAVVAAVAAVLGLEGDVPIAVSLPAGLWQAEGHALARALADPIGVLLQEEGRRRWIRPEPHILAEPVAAWCAVVLGEDGTPDRNAISEVWSVIDVGHRTVDLAVVSSARPASLSSTPLGALAVWEAWLRETVEPEIGLLRDDERAEIVAAITGGGVPIVRGRALPQSLIARLEVYRSRWARRLVEEIRSLLAGQAFHRLLCAGGGAEWARQELLAAWPFAVISQEARWAVATGGLRYLQYVSKR
jgi:hypothetical protein